MKNLETIEMDHRITSGTGSVNAIGLKATKAKELAKMLNVLLASYSVFYQNVRGCHWNVKGEKFFELHAKFEQLYGSLYEKIDAVAERILMIGFAAQHNFSDYELNSMIKESMVVSNGIKAAEDILTSLQTVITLEREILSFSNEMDDEGTYALMSDNIRDHEKLAWMYGAYLKNN